jgi:hypothetical protein
LSQVSAAQQLVGSPALGNRLTSTITGWTADAGRSGPVNEALSELPVDEAPLIGPSYGVGQKMNWQEEYRFECYLVEESPTASEMA